MLIGATSIGRVIAVARIWIVDESESYFSVNWRRMLVGGPALTNHIHEIDFLRLIFGKITSVCAFQTV